MSQAPPSPTHRAEQDHYLADFQAFAGNGAAGAPAWLRDLRAGAIARFAELGFPTTRQEEWRFTSIAPILERPFARAAREVPVSAAELAPLGLGAGPRVVFVDGRFVPGLSRRTGLPRGGHVGSLAGALEGGLEGELARAHLARHARWRESAFAALNTAFLTDAAFVHVPANATVPEPIDIVFVSTGRAGPGPTVSHPRSLVVIEPGADASVVETYAGTGGPGVYWTNGVGEVVVGDGARAEFYRVQREGPDGYHVATTHTEQGRDSRLDVHVVSLGALLARHDIATVLAGTGAELILNGLYLLDAGQHADHHTLIDHAQPHGTSHEFFNGVMAERSHGVFNGRIIVRPGAQRTDSKQTNNNLLLSTEARADSQPQLEIYANDVKCTHGSTVGPLDEGQLYYLRSRGIAPAVARHLLTYGFGAEILGRMTRPAVRDRLDALVRGRFA